VYQLRDIFDVLHQYRAVYQNVLDCLLKEIVKHNIPEFSVNSVHDGFEASAS